MKEKKIKIKIKKTKMTTKFKKKTIVVNNKMQKNYKYDLICPIGKNFHKDFKPDFTPKQMLALGVFGGKYMNDTKDEYPKDWWTKAKLCNSCHDPLLNYYKVNASQDLSVWRNKGWIYKDDPRGWFEWYCRYYMGRRIEGEDDRQIKRWKAMRRHIGQIVKNCRQVDMNCRRVQRQALLHWSYDSRNI